MQQDYDESQQENQQVKQAVNVEEAPMLNIGYPLRNEPKPQQQQSPSQTTIGKAIPQGPIKTPYGDDAPEGNAYPNMDTGGEL